MIFWCMSTIYRYSNNSDMPNVVNGCIESNGAKVLILFVEINSWLKTKTNSLLIAVRNKTGFAVVTIIWYYILHFYYYACVNNTKNQLYKCHFQPYMYECYI